MANSQRLSFDLLLKPSKLATISVQGVALAVLPGARGINSNLYRNLSSTGVVATSCSLWLNLQNVLVLILMT